MSDRNPTTNPNLGNRMDSVKQAVKGLAERSHGKAATVRSRLIEVTDRAITKGNAMNARLIELIKAHPMTAIGIAFGAGYLGTRLVRR